MTVCEYSFPSSESCGIHLAFDEFQWIQYEIHQFFLGSTPLQELELGVLDQVI